MQKKFNTSNHRNLAKKRFIVCLLIFAAVFLASFLASTVYALTAQQVKHTTVTSAEFDYDCEDCEV